MSEELIKRARELTQRPPRDWTWEAAVERQTERLSLMRQLADALDAAHEAMRVVCIDPYEGRELCLKLLNRRAETEG